jgi:hypothetical protein
MVETAALQAAEVLPALPLRQCAIRLPFAPRFLFAALPDPPGLPDIPSTADGHNDAQPDKIA